MSKNTTENGKITPFHAPEKHNKLEVVIVNFDKVEEMTWQELFFGYDRLYAMTFSYGLDFIEKILPEFSYAEIILGCEPLVKFDLQTIMAHQLLTIDEIKRYKYLTHRVANEDVVFYISKEITSHQKVFILEGNDRRSRIILGSGNLSGRSFSNAQIENIEVIENNINGYLYYMERFQTLKALSSTEVIKEALFTPLDDNITTDVETIPIVREVKMSDVGIIIEEGRDDPTKIDYVYNLKHLAKEYESIIPKKEKDGKILLTPLKITKMIAKRKKQNETKQEQQAIYPQFLLDYDNFSAQLNNRKYDLSPDINTVKSDLIQLVEYFNGFEQFEGDIIQLQKQYYNMLNYMLLSPFVAKLRYHAHLSDFPTRVFPLYAVLCGKSDAGKSAFIETVQALMFGKRLGNISPSYFTKKNIYALQREIHGVPVHIEDLLNTKFNLYCGEIVKYDEDLIQDVLLNHPTFILSSNDIKSIKPEYSKRIIVMYIEGNLPKVKATTNHKKMIQLRKSITTSFYSEYLRRMFPVVMQLIQEMENHEGTEEWIPDIFQKSSSIIIDIFRDCDLDIPEYVRILSYNDYFGSGAIGSRVYNKIRRDWKYNPKAFQISRRQNKLVYQPGENQYEATWIYNELPTELRAECSGLRVIMELNKAEEFFGVKFRKKIFER